MNEPMYPAKTIRTEIMVKNSRFIATASPASSVEGARTFIRRIKAEFADASHNVSAFIIGYGNSTISHCSDDGEPSGTAGRPILAVLEGSGISDIVIVISRYFGGIKLGRGGLVKAYGSAAKDVINNLPLAMKVPVHLAKIRLHYQWYERVHQLIERFKGVMIDEEFGVDVLIVFKIEIKQFEDFQNALQQLSQAQLSVAVFDTKIDVVPI